MGLDSRTLRKQILKKRDELSDTDIREKSTAVHRNLERLPEINDASTLLVYVHFRSEVRTLSFIRDCLSLGKNILVPVTLVTEKRIAPVRIMDPENDLEPGYCGIPEPLRLLDEQGEEDPVNIDLVLLPGSVFDRRGGRFGYGGGYYDRFLAMEAPHAARIGVAYELQIVDRLSLEPHDQLMDKTVTEKTIYTCRR